MTKKKFGIKARKLKRRADEWKAIKLNVVNRIKSDMKKEKEVVATYIEHNRYIPQNVYMQLKKRKFCDYCHKPFVNSLPEIHHKIPISKGGDNSLKNLMSLCSDCHKKLDKEAGV